MSERKGILYNPVILLGVLATCVYEGGRSWLFVGSPAVPSRDLVLLAGLAWAVFVSAALAWRSKFRGDRVAFGAFAGATALEGLEAAVSFGPRLALLLNAAKASLYTVVALACLAVLTCGSWKRDMGSAGASDNPGPRSGNEHE